MLGCSPTLGEAFSYVAFSRCAGGVRGRHTDHLTADTSGPAEQSHGGGRVTLQLAQLDRTQADLPFSESRRTENFIPIILEIFKTKYVQEADGPSHIFGVLGRWSENCSIDFLDNPQEEVPVNALRRHGGKPTGFEA